ncbi:hypothetical protein BDV96DRAFT_615971 [Lophiotrema nucula]|uniref:DUF1640-domain-containing protein n=1 Tax=Lophiotrema nucula TaxID=690887 RepID=A0A6A5YPA5_9PLEO|nr:hypothetical protein BDV96DRAFT_615971 [Lophiotrema nucula]
MATPAMQASAIPRFLLPRITWAAGSVRPGILGTVVEARHRHASPAASHAPTHRYRTFRTASQAGTPIQCAIQCSQASTALNAFSNARRGFSATARTARDHHFDTLKFVQRLKDEGFTEEQAEAMMRVLSDVIEESIQNLTRTMVLREDQEKATYTQKVDFAKLRSELMTADSTESSLTRASHERLTNELAKLNSRLRDDIQRTQASVRLDLNLEKGRIREEANVQELKIKETETRIEQETAQLRERLEAVKFSTLQWLMGVCTGTAALMLGVWRLLM